MSGMFVSKSLLFSLLLLFPLILSHLHHIFSTLFLYLLSTNLSYIFPKLLPSLVLFNFFNNFFFVFSYFFLCQFSHFVSLSVCLIAFYLNVCLFVCLVVRLLLCFDIVLAYFTEWVTVCWTVWEIDCLLNCLRDRLFPQLSLSDC